MYLLRPMLPLVAVIVVGEGSKKTLLARGSVLCCRSNRGFGDLSGWRCRGSCEVPAKLCPHQEHYSWTAKGFGSRRRRRCH